MAAGQTTINWELVEERLSRIPREYFDPRFDSLKEVISVVGAVDSEVQVDQLRKWKQTVEQLVDDVVEAYYAGFNRSLQNYTRILKLFSDSRNELDTLRRSLDSSHRALSAHSQQLKDCYHAGLMLSDVKRLLQDVILIIAVPERVEKHRAAGEWQLAVTTLLEACNKLARKELEGIAALDALRTDIRLCRTTLIAALVEEIEKQTYTVQLPTSSTTQQHQKQGSGHFSKVRHQSSGSIGAPVVQHRRTQSYAPRHILSDVSGHLLDNSQQKTSLVDCLIELGGLNAAMTILQAHCADKMRDVIESAIDSYAQESHYNISSTSSTSSHTDDPQKRLAKNAIALLRHIFQHCSHALQSVCQLMNTLGSAKPGPSSAGLDLLLEGESTSSSSHQKTSTLTSQECAHAWECMQLQCESVLEIFLNVAALSWQTSASSNASNQGAGWLYAKEQANSAAAASGTDTGNSALVFSLEQEMVKNKSPEKKSPLAKESSFGTSSITSSSSSKRASEVGGKSPPHVQTIYRVLGARPKGPELAAVAFIPVMEFVDEADKIVLNAVTTSAGSQAAKKLAGGQRLKAYMEHVIRMEFLPSIYVSSRERCSAVLSNPDSFKPRLHVHQPYTAQVLPAAAACVALTENLLDQASNVPPFAAHISGVLENGLGRMANAFQEQISATLGNSIAGSFAFNVPVVQAMAREPAAALLGSPAAFVTGKNADAMDTFVSSVVAAGYGARDESQGRVVWSLLLKERPIAASQLISGGASVARVVTLASLANSVDHIANELARGTDAASVSIQGGGSQPETPTKGGGTGLQTSATAAAEASPKLQLQEGLQRLVRLSKTWRQQGGSSREKGFVDALNHVADKFRALSGQCLRALRLEVLFLVIYSLELLPQLPSPGTDSAEVEERVLNIARLLPRLRDGIAAYLTTEQLEYTFGPLADASAHFAMDILREFQTPLDATCVTRLCRLLSTIQPVIAAVCPQRDASRQIETAKQYYALLMQPPDAIVSLATSKPRHFSAKAYMYLLEANVVGRVVTGEQREKLQQVLIAAR